MSGAVAVARFQLAGFVRSGHVLFPAVLLAVLLGVQSGMPSSAAVSFTDSAAFAFPLFALATHQLLASEPDVQRAVSTVHAGSRRTYLLAGLLAAFALNLVFLVCCVASALRGPLGGTATTGDLPGLLALGVGIHLLALLPGLALGAVTSRTVTGDAPAEYICLVGGLLAAVLLGLAIRPVSWLSVPLLDLMRAAHDGRLTAALPAVTAHTLIWSLVVGAGYLWLRRRAG